MMSPRMMIDGWFRRAMDRDCSVILIWHEEGSRSCWTSLHASNKYWSYHQNSVLKAFMAHMNALQLAQDPSTGHKQSTPFHSFHSTPALYTWGQA